MFDVFASRFQSREIILTFQRNWNVIRVRILHLTLSDEDLEFQKLASALINAVR